MHRGNLELCAVPILVGSSGQVVAHGRHRRALEHGLAAVGVGGRRAVEPAEHARDGVQPQPAPDLAVRHAAPQQQRGRVQHRVAINLGVPAGAGRELEHQPEQRASLLEHDPQARDRKAQELQDGPAPRGAGGRR